ncbi:MAG: HAD family hydrolase [Desulfovibrio sp.]|nr:HAD family hydrolase [Desulfovibrio sp.]
MPARAVFLDRDGTLNQDRGYVHSRESFVWLPHVFPALSLLASQHFILVVVSNQSGIARGFYTMNEVKTLEDALTKELTSQGIPIHGWYYCPHHPDVTGPCSCRKPAPGLLRNAAADLNIDLGESWMVGDKLSDVRAGQNAGCHVLKMKGTPDEDIVCVDEGIPVCRDLLQAAQIITRF